MAFFFLKITKYFCKKAVDEKMKNPKHNHPTKEALWSQIYFDKRSCEIYIHLCMVIREKEAMERGKRLAKNLFLLKLDI